MFCSQYFIPQEEGRKCVILVYAFDVFFYKRKNALTKISYIKIWKVWEITKGINWSQAMLEAFFKTKQKQPNFAPYLINETSKILVKIINDTIE